MSYEPRLLGGQTQLSIFPFSVRERKPECIESMYDCTKYKLVIYQSGSMVESNPH